MTASLDPTAITSPPHPDSPNRDASASNIDATRPTARERAAERPGSALLWGALLAGAAVLALSRRRSPTREPTPAAPEATTPHHAVRERAARRLDAGAATLAFSVLADSALEHYRAGFYNRLMYAAPAVSALTLATAVSAACRPHAGGRARTAVFGLAALTGLVGSGFHVANISRRHGGWSWQNLFYGAPVAAPLGIHLAGLLGLAGEHLVRADGTAPVRIAGLPAGRVLALGTATGLMGTAGEAALLHFRGAFHNPYMWLPVILPPAAALTLAGAAVGGAHAPARALLGATTLLGVLGVGFHAYGVSRNMGGWRNWTQNVQNGPPLPAPPSFTGLAIAGLGALDLLGTEVRA